MDGWETFPVEFRGGLVTNLSPLQQGINKPGSARQLINYEPSIEGGYKKIKGYDKYDSNLVPAYGNVIVHGASQTGTTLIATGFYTAPEAGDTFTIAGVSGTYTIASGGVSHSTSTYRATLTLTGALDSSPANGAAITFTSTTTQHPISGVYAWHQHVGGSPQVNVIAARNNGVFKSTGSGWSFISVINYGTPIVDGGSQTGTTLVADGLDAFPQAGDILTIDGVDLTYTVTTAVTSYSDAGTKEVNITISPALDSSPADNAAITFTSSKLNFSTGNRVRFARNNLDGTERFILVNGTCDPIAYDGTNYERLTGATSNSTGAQFVINHKNTTFFGKDDVLTFTAPYTYDDFLPANGAGEIRIGDTITGLVVFRDILFIFSEEMIHKLTGTSIADFNLEPVTEDFGCTEPDTIQEIGTDVMFLGPDGLRLLSATDRDGDFNFNNVSKDIQNVLKEFVSIGSSFSSVAIRKKSQYRIFSYNASYTTASSRGIISTTLSSNTEEDGPFALSETRGIKALVAHSDYLDNTEVIVFANTDGYVYELEMGNSFDGSNIPTIFATPHWPINDPRKRKTIYKVHLYTDPEGAFSFDMSIRLDFDGQNVLQPPAIAVTNSGSTTESFYGDATYNTNIYTVNLSKVFSLITVGSGFTCSLVFENTDQLASHALDSVVLEYRQDDRR